MTERRFAQAVAASLVAHGLALYLLDGLSPRRVVVTDFAPLQVQLLRAPPQGAAATQSTLQPIATQSTLQASAPQRPDFAGLSLRCGAGRWGSAWECQLPWAAARLLIA